MELIDEIKDFEKEWNDIIVKDIKESDKLVELLKEAIHNAAPINHKHKKQQKFVF